MARAFRGSLKTEFRDRRVDHGSTVRGDPSASSVRRGWRWADLMRRVFAVDVHACARGGGRLRLIATLEASETTRRILRHLDLPTEVPLPTPAGAPPCADDWAF